MLINVYNAAQTVPYAVRTLCCTNGILYGRYAAQTVCYTDAMVHRRHAARALWCADGMSHGRDETLCAC